MVRFREILSAMGVAALVVLIGAVLATLDPMGLDDAADRHSADVVARMTAPFYGGGQPVGQRSVTAVEISDATLREMGVEWPAPRKFYTAVLDTLAPEDGPKPAAIFFDYMLLSDLGDPEGHTAFIDKVRRITRARAWEADPACRASPAAKITCIVKAGGVPVILGKPYPADVCAAGLGDDVSALLRLDQAAVMVPLGWPGAPDSALPVLRREDYRANLIGQLGATQGEAVFDSCRLLQPAVDAAGNPRLLSPSEPGGPPMTWWGVKTYDLSPAAAMFVALCQGERAARRPAPATCDAMVRPDGRLTWTEPRAATVTWGSAPDKAFLDLRLKVYGDAEAHDKPCRAETKTIGRVLGLGWRQLSSAIGDGVAAVQVPCPYHPTLDYAALRGEVDGGTPAGEVIRRDYLTGRVVVVGAAMVASTDWIDTVVHGRLAGVHYHAMMLDNLVERGAGVLRPPPPVFSAGNPLSVLKIDWGEMLEYGVAFIVVLVVEIGRRRMEAREKRDGRALLWVLLVFVWAGVVMTAATAITVQLHWKPVNVIGLFTLTLVDAAASFWSVEGATWLVSAGWMGARAQGRRVGRGLADVVMALARGIGLIFSGLRKQRSPKPSQRGAAKARRNPPTERPSE